MSQPVEELVEYADAQHDAAMNYLAEIADIRKQLDAKDAEIKRLRAEAASQPALLAACKMDELLADYRARSSWSEEQIKFFRRLGELATIHGWDGEDTSLSGFVRDFRRAAIALAEAEKP